MSPGGILVSVTGSVPLNNENPTSHTSFQHSDRAGWDTVRGATKLAYQVVAAQWEIVPMALLRRAKLLDCDYCLRRTSFALATILVASLVTAVVASAAEPSTP